MCLNVHVSAGGQVTDKDDVQKYMCLGLLLVFIFQ